MIVPGVGAWLISSKNEWAFGCCNADGTLDIDKLRKYLDIFERNRAGFVRVLPYLLKDSTGHGALSVGDSNHFPFVYDNGKFNLDKINPLWLDAVRTVGVECNKRNIVLFFCCFDRCHKRPGPWTNNHQKISGWRDFNPYVTKYIDAVLLATRGLKVAYLDENEPEGTTYADFAKQFRRYLEGKGVASKDIHAGGEFYHKDALQQKAAIEAVGRDYRVSNLSSFHHMDEERWAYIYPRYQVEPAQTEGRRFFLSDDGLKEKRTLAQNYAFYFEKFRLMPNLSALNCWIESCAAPYPGDNTPIEELFSACGGVALAAGLELLPDPVVPVPDPIVPDPITPDPIIPTEKDMRLFTNKEGFPGFQMNFAAQPFFVKVALVLELVLHGFAVYGIFRAF